jgi:hypothetical protein
MEREMNSKKSNILGGKSTPMRHTMFIIWQFLFQVLYRQLFSLMLACKLYPILLFFWQSTSSHDSIMVQFSCLFSQVWGLVFNQQSCYVG